MSLQPTLVEFVVTKGLKQGVDGRFAPGDTPAKLVNAEMLAEGAVTPREGYGALASGILDGGTVPFFDGLDTKGDELLGYGLAGDSLPHAYSYSDAAQLWQDRGTVCPCSFSTRQVASPYVGAVNPRVAMTSDGFRSYVWSIFDDATSVAGQALLIIRIEDPTNGTVVFDDTLIDSPPGPLQYVHFALGTGAVVLFNHTHLQYYSKSIGHAPLVVTISAITTQMFDACPIDSGNFFIAWIDPGSTTVLRVAEINAAGTITASATYSLGGRGPVVLTVAATSAHRWVALDPGGAVGVELQLWPPGLAAPTWTNVVAAGSTATNIGVAIDGTTACVAWSGIGGVGDPQGVWAREMDISGAVTGHLTQTVNCFLASRPFYFNHRAFVFASQFLDNTQCLVCVNYPFTAPPYLGWLCGVISRISSDVGAVAAAITLCPLGTPCPSDTATIEHAIEATQNVASQYGTIVYGCTLDFTGSQPWLRQPAEAMGCVSHSGALVGWYDGFSEVELGFASKANVAVSAVATGSVTAGDHLITAVYEWRDKTGAIHRSEPSPLKKVTIAANQKIHVDIDCLGLTRKGIPRTGALRDVTIAVFCTLVNGTTLYRITPPLASIVDAVQNDPTAGSVPFVINLADNQIQALGYGTLYTDGGILESTTVPGARAVLSAGARLWALSDDDGREVLFSTLATPTEAPSFNRILSLRVDEAPDDLSALGELDGSVYIFTPSRIYEVTGSGPNDTGVGGFGGPFLVSRDAGCTDPRSVVTFPGGIMFRSKGGIYLLGRDKIVQNIGIDVQNEIASDAQVVSAKVHADKQKVILVLWSDQLSRSTILVYDYAYDVWTTRAIYVSGDGAPLVTNTYAQAVWKGHHVVFTGGTLMEGRGAHVWEDAGAFFSTVVETPWIKTSAINGFQRVWFVNLLGKFFAPHNLKLEVFSDYNDATPTQTQTFDVSDTTTLAGLPVERLRLHVKQQRCAAIKARVTTLKGSVVSSPPIAKVAACDISAITFSIGVIPAKTRPLPAGNKG